MRSQIAQIRVVPIFVTRTTADYSRVSSRFGLRSPGRSRYCVLHVCFTPSWERALRATVTDRGRATTTAVTGVSSRASSASREPALLLLLREHPAHGYDLLDRLPELTGEQRVEMGNLYRLFRALEEEGLVKSAWDDASPGPGETALCDHARRRAAARTLDRGPAALTGADRGLPRSLRTRKGGELMHHGVTDGHHGEASEGFISTARSRTGKSSSSACESYQRDLEQELVDIEDLIRHLRGNDQPQPSTSEG